MENTFSILMRLSPTWKPSPSLPFSKAKQVESELALHPNAGLCFFKLTEKMA